MMGKGKKQVLPEEALEFFRRKGAEGGAAKVPKGFALMPKKKRQKAARQAAKARAANRAKQEKTK